MAKNSKRELAQIPTIANIDIINESTVLDDNTVPADIPLIFKFN